MNDKNIECECTRERLIKVETKQEVLSYQFQAHLSEEKEYRENVEKTNERMFGILRDIQKGVNTNSRVVYTIMGGIAAAVTIITVLINLGIISIALGMISH